MGRGGVTGPVERRYCEKVEAGELAGDPAQRDAARALDSVLAGLAQGSGGSGLFGLFRKKPAAPTGLYLWGDVGRGKTMLMDLFLAAAQEPKKRRVHFHEFMNEVHEAIAAYRAGNADTSGARDPVPAVARPIAAKVRLLCFDEFLVSDITDAMLLKRLFEVLFAEGVVVVATSNIPPEKLYWNGLNRQLFTPFIDLLKSRVAVFNLDAETDYRREKLDPRDVYAFGPDAETRPRLDAVFAHFSGGEAPHPGSIASLGRVIAVPAQAGRVARFDFEDLCGKPLGARDYLKVADAFDMVVIDGVPVFSRLRSDASKRFITLVDTLYDRGIKLAASFAAPLEDLAQDDKTRFEFARCLSRLEEMRSAAYLEQGQRQKAG